MVLSPGSMSLTLPTTAINVIPPTPDAAAAAASSPSDTADTDSAAANADDGEKCQPVADDKIVPTSVWLRRHVDIFTHLSEGLMNTSVFA